MAFNVSDLGQAIRTAQDHTSDGTTNNPEAFIFHLTDGSEFKVTGGLNPNRIESYQEIIGKWTRARWKMGDVIREHLRTVTTEEAVLIILPEHVLTLEVVR